MQKPNVRKQLFREFEAAFDKNFYAYSAELGEEYLKQYPKDRKAWLMYAKMLRKQARYSDAQPAVQRVIKDKPDWLAFAEMGRLYQSKGDLKKAAEWYRKGIEAKPERTPCRIFLGAVLARQGRLKEAEECYRRAAECPEGDIDEALYNLGLVLLFQGGYEEARQCFVRALELDSDYRIAKDALKDMVKVLVARRAIDLGGGQESEKKRKQRFREFEAAYEQRLYACHLELGKAYLRQYPHDLSARLLYGIALRQMARYPEARLALQHVIKRLSDKPVRAWPLAEMGQLYEAKGDLKTAAAWYRKSIAAKPEDADGHSLLGKVLTRQGRFAEAEACHRRATECPEGDVGEAFVNLGFVLRAQGRYEEARQCFLKALEREPKFKAVKRLVKDLDKALEFREKVKSNEVVR